ncbi:MAG: TadE/TadG family type IV pilus assembly protein [Pseudomonadota bacterium]
MLRAKFRSNQSGQAAVFFAIALFPIIAVMGVCLDYQTQMERKVKVQAVLDAAVLAAARVRQSGATETDIEAALINFVTPQVEGLPGLVCQQADVNLPSGELSIKATLSCTQDTALMSLLGQETVNVVVGSTSNYAINALDAAFMIDVSGSMRNGNRLVDLKAAMTDALDILLPASAPPEATANTRIAMASYGSMLNAGPYFEQVTGLTATRTYSDTIETEIQDSEIDRGRRYSEIKIYLYDADTGDRIVEIGHGAMIKVEPEQLNSVTIVVEPKNSYSRHDELESIEFKLSGTKTANQVESVEPYSLYGDSGLDALDGERWRTGKYELRLRAFDGNGATGREILDKTLEFELFVEGDMRSTDQSFTLTSTCVWERDGDEKFTDAPPGPGNYLAAHSAWYKQYNANSPGGYWAVGFNEHGEQDYTGSLCRTPAPIELTNKRSDLDTYVSTLRADGSTAGHLGVAWTWYLISDRWSSVFDDTAAPAMYTNNDVQKAVILMTDGDFNVVGHRGQGDSATQARALCDGMKDKGIKIFAVAFKAPAQGQSVLSDCASSASTYFNAANTDDLKAAYREIAVALSDLRIAE